MTATTLQAAPRPRDYVAVTGPDAAAHLERMVSNAVEALAPGESCAALLLTPKARIVAPVVALRRADDDFLLLTEPGLGEAVRAVLVRARLRARCEIVAEAHRSTILLGAATGGLPCPDYGVPAVELLDAEPPAAAGPIEPEALERLRILAGTPRWGTELDDRVLPAEAGLEERFVSFGKGCYPGQEPVARLHYRGHPNRTLRVLAIDDGALPADDAELSLDGRAVGRVTSAARDPGLGIVALAYVRREVDADETLRLPDGRHVRPAACRDELGTPAPSS
jgi:folate-binding protein YgfZ